MGYDRRTVLSVLLLNGLLPGCAKATQPSGKGPWPMFASRFLAPEGRIVDTGNGGISHSEGQGYGLILAESAGDRATFDRIWEWTNQTLSRQDVRLFSWRYDPSATPRVTDPNNATDGDILIAWALLLAARRWSVPDYADQSRAIRSAIWQKLVYKIGSLLVLLPGLEGFVEATRVTVNPSYYVWPALRAFAAVDQPWNAFLRDSERLLALAKFGTYSLPTDWIDIFSDGSVVPAIGRPARFGFDAIRVPLYLAWSGQRAVLQPYKAFWTPYIQQRRPIPAWIDVTSAETAPYPLSDGGRMVVDLATNQKPKTISGDYYSSALGALAQLAG